MGCLGVKMAEGRDLEKLCYRPRLLQGEKLFLAYQQFPSFPVDFALRSEISAYLRPAKSRAKKEYRENRTLLLTLRDTTFIGFRSRRFQNTIRSFLPKEISNLTCRKKNFPHDQIFHKNTRKTTENIRFIVLICESL